MGLLEWPHEVNAPNIEDLYLQVVVEGHCIVSYNATLQLIFLTPLDELLGVFVHRWPEEPVLPDFGLHAEYSVMASVRRCMAFLDDLQSFYHWYISPQ
jgi:hypothetical protein